uniref:PB1 domain-containing protein n=1 Tax=Syphacia muris TaxID=451379 RepID=A0A0N5AT82_9BILA
MSNEKSGNSDIERTLIKARFGNDVRKVSVRHNEDLSYDDLCIMMQRIFKIEPSTNIILKYRDEDNDLVTIADDNDLLLALNTQRNLSIVALAECGDVSNIEKFVFFGSALEDLKLIKTCGVEPPVFGVGGNERPDTPAHKETVATIQPSVHEQVDFYTGCFI